MAGINVVGHRIAVALLCVTLGSFTVAAKALAQAGSSGGTIGDIDKSVSGTRPEPKVRKQATVPRNIAVSSCGKMPGNWSWFNYPTVVIRPDGTATAGPFSATWSCKDDVVVMHWSHGYTDRLRLLRDGTHLEGTNGRVTVTGDRR